MALKATVVACEQFALQNLKHMQTLIQDDNSHTRDIEHPQFPAALRCQVITWLFEFSFQSALSTKTAQLACLYFDTTSPQVKDPTPVVLRLLAATCLMVSSKFEDVAIVSPENIAVYCGVPLENILMLELYVLTCLNWDLDLATAAETSRLLLAVSAPEHDFTQVIEESDCFSNVCYQDSSLLQAGPVLVAVAAVCCVFERHSSLQHRDNWLDIVLNHTALNRNSVLEFSALIKRKIEARFQTKPERGEGRRS